MEIEERMRTILRSKTPDRGRFSWLQHQSKIHEANWKSFFYKRQRPNPDMFEWVCQEWPEFCLWLMTGSTFHQTGQIRPVTDKFRGVMHQDLWAAKYLKSKIALQKHIIANGLDEDNLKTEDVPTQIQESMKGALDMATQEIKRLLDKPDQIWEVNPTEEAPPDLSAQEPTMTLPIFHK
jgi:hypothetical protein